MPDITDTDQPDTSATDGTTAPVGPDNTEGAPDPETEPTTFSAEYVRKLRAEAAESRVKAKIADTANEHLLAAYAGADGRLVDTEVLPLSDDLLGEDGLVDAAKVSDAIGGLVTAKPYLLARKPSPLPGQGLTPPAPADVGWLTVLRGEA